MSIAPEVSYRHRRRIADLHDASIRLKILIAKVTAEGVSAEIEADFRLAIGHFDTALMRLGLKP